MARTTDLIPSVQKRICDALREGNTNRVSALLGGVSERTFYEWLQRGDANEEPFAQFAQAVEGARAEAEAVALAAVTKAARGWVETVDETWEDADGSGTRTKRRNVFDWRAASWFMERSNPESWAARNKLEVSGHLAGDAGVIPLRPPA